MTDLAIIFIDALPHSQVDRLSVGPEISFRPMRSGVGYSVNAKAELFAGLLPDDLGLLNEYSMVNAASLGPGRFLQGVDRFERTSWLLRRVARRLTGGQINNIPFGQGRLFNRAGQAAYEREFHLPTVLDRVEERVLYSQVTEEDRDSAVLSQLLSAMRAGARSVFAAFPDLDRSLHQVGFRQSMLESKLDFYSDAINYVSTLASSVVIISDHGMSPIVEICDIWNPARLLAKQTGARYFLDSTMMRVWSPAGSIDDWSAFCVDHGLVELTRSERSAYGVSSLEFGTHIAFCREGFVFSPNFYGRARGLRPGEAAMHGYHPRSEAQVGVLGGFGEWSRLLPSTGNPEVSTLDVYRMLNDLLAKPDVA